MKLFNASNITAVKINQKFFGFQLPSVLSNRVKKFKIQFHESSRPTNS